MIKSTCHVQLGFAYARACFSWAQTLISMSTLWKLWQTAVPLHHALVEGKLPILGQVLLLRTLILAVYDGRKK